MDRYSGQVRGKRGLPLVLVNVRIDRLGIDEVLPFLVDTGADISALSAGLLETDNEALGEPTLPARGIGGRAKRWEVRGAKLRIRAHAGSPPCDITPRRLFSIEHLEDVCILGRDVLREHGLALHLDIRRRTLQLEG